MRKTSLLVFAICFLAICIAKASAKGSHDREFVPYTQSSRKSPLEQRAVKLGLTNQKKFISWNEEGRPPSDTTYQTDDNEGEGVDMYIIDSGFNVDVPELSDRYIKPVTYFVSNEIAAPNIANTLEASIEDRRGHGTRVAILAGGKTLGIAPRSGLYLLKPTADFKMKDGTSGNQGTPNSYRDVTDKVISYIKSRPGRKAVVNMSQDIPIVESHYSKQYRKVFEDFIANLDHLGVALVLAAGNQGLNGETTADTIPQCLGTPDNNVITIGGLNYDGTLWLKTTPEGKSGSITAYNLATHLTIMTASGTLLPSTTIYEGTSYAAALTIGTIAVLLGIKPEHRVNVYAGIKNIYDESGTRPSARKTKAYFIGLTFERCRFFFGDDEEEIPSYELPKKLNAVYNGARGPPVIC